MIYVLLVWVVLLLVGILVKLSHIYECLNGIHRKQ